MREEIWAILGTIPNSRSIRVLGVVEGSREKAEITKDERKEEAFKERSGEAIFFMWDLLFPNINMTKARLRQYLKQVGTPEDALDDTMMSILLSFPQRIRPKA
ncbi:hypothetical protein KW800_01540 [Candidatus Parcubacteria bacterium]|nr:hypothetical protein [Candidatus Parcubacteria bacterium]